VSRSVEAASIKETRKEEAHLGGAIHAPKEGLKGSFARSGKVGQWREFFDEADLDRIRTRLRKGGIDLEEFCLDPKTTS